MTSENENRDSYFQCPYCSRFKGGLGVRVPKTVGKYKVMVIHGNILKLKCARCAKEFKMIFENPTKYLWSTMTRKEREAFKKEHYKGGQK